MIRYLLARYTDDLTRNEPINVGVIVYDGTRALARFDGEDPRTQTIDLRRVRHRITGSNTYRAWVAYWRRGLTEPAVLAPQLAGAQPGDPAVIEFLLGLGGDEFSLIRGGEIVFDGDERSLEATLRDLYERLVRAPEPDAPPSLRDKSEQAMRLAGVPLDDADRFRTRPKIPLNVEGHMQEQEVSYGVLNGRWHYLQEASFDPRSERVSSKEAHHVAFIFEHATDTERNGGLEHDAKVVLYDGTDLVENTRGLLELITPFAQTIDVSAPKNAAEPLGRALALA
jgi:hypothetical protein